VEWETKLDSCLSSSKEFARILKGTLVPPPAAKVLDMTKATNVSKKQIQDSSNCAYKELLLSISMMLDEGCIAFHIVTSSSHHYGPTTRWQSSSCMEKTEGKICPKN